MNQGKRRGYHSHGATSAVASLPGGEQAPITASVFPMMDEDELRTLADDIVEHDLLAPTSLSAGTGREHGGNFKPPGPYSVQPLGIPGFSCFHCFLVRETAECSEEVHSSRVAEVVTDPGCKQYPAGQLAGVTGAICSGKEMRNDA